MGEEGEGEGRNDCACAHEYEVEELGSTHAFTRFISRATCHPTCSHSCCREQVTRSGDQNPGPDNPANSELVNV